MLYINPFLKALPQKQKIKIHPFTNLQPHTELPDRKIDK